MVTSGISLDAALPAGESSEAKITNATHTLSPLLLSTGFTQLRGVDRSGTEYMCIDGYGYGDGPYNLTSVQAIRSWNVTAVRIPLNEDCWLGINVNGTTAAAWSGAGYRAYIVTYVDLLESQGIRPILDLHWNAPGTNKSTGQEPMADENHALAFWASVASTFRNDSLVIFDLYNEPYGISWSCWLNGCFQTNTNPGWQTAGMQQLLDAVRSEGADTQLVILGGLNWSNDESGWLSHEPTDPAGQGHLGVSLHMYSNNACANAKCWNTTLLPILNAGIPLITGEMGEYDCNASFIESYWAWADPLHVSYLGWTWDAWNSCNGPTLIASYNGTPYKVYGTEFRDHLRGFAVPPASPPSVPVWEEVQSGNAMVKVNWSAPASDGTWPITDYQVAWGISPSNLDQNLSTTSMELTVQPLTNGQTYYFAVRAENEVGYGPWTSPVAGAPRVPSLTVSLSAFPNPTTYGQTTYLNSTATGGAPSYAYAYTGLPFGCVTANVSSLVCVPDVTGSFTVRVFVNDSAHDSATATVDLTVNTPVNSLTDVAVSPVSVTLAYGGNEVFVATPTCTETCPAGMTYSWTLTNYHIGSINATTGTSVTFNAGSVAGTVGIFVNATLTGVTERSSAIITVGTTAPVLTSVETGPGGLSIVSGGRETFAAIPTCTATCPSGITYVWALTNAVVGSLSADTGSEVIFTAGNTSAKGGIFVNATLNGITKTGEGLITVTATTVVLDSVYVSPEEASISTGASMTFIATPECNVGCPSGIAYTWSNDDSVLGTLYPNTGNMVTFTAGSSTGEAAITVSATLNGKTVSQSAEIIVTTSSCTGTCNTCGDCGTSSFNTMLYALACAAMFTAVAVVLWLLMFRGRKGHPESVPDPNLPDFPVDVPPSTPPP
jgi:hypothetical protein